MDKRQRDIAKLNRTQNTISEIETILKKANIAPSRRLLNQFIEWRIIQDWKQFEQERMDIYIVEKNTLNSQQLSFPNGKKGEPYNKSIQFDMSRYQKVWIEKKPTGLSESIDKENGFITLSGTPTEAKDFEFTLKVKLNGWQEGDPIIERNFRIAFNPDPRDLWNDLPVPADIPFPKDDTAADYVKVPKFENNPQKDIVAASKRGRSHAHEGKPRDDHFKIDFEPTTGWYILTVADGAGSAKYSREGSKIACETAQEIIKKELVEDNEHFEDLIKLYDPNDRNKSLSSFANEINKLLYTAAKTAHKRISECVDKCKYKPVILKDFSTTLLISICRKFDFGWFIASFGVGDGAIGLYVKNSDKISLLNEPDGGEYAGQTRFVTMESIFTDRARTKMTIVPDFTALMLMTDGISDPKFETDANLEKKEKWDNLWEDLNNEVDFSDDNEKSQHQLLKWLDFWSPGNHDDRTIAILY